MQKSSRGTECTPVFGIQNGYRYKLVRRTKRWYEEMAEAAKGAKYCEGAQKVIEILQRNDQNHCKTVGGEKMSWIGQETCKASVGTRHTFSREKESPSRNRASVLNRAMRGKGVAKPAQKLKIPASDGGWGEDRKVSLGAERPGKT